MAEMVAEADVVIVGAGIVGCSLALHLARLGHRDVLVVDRGTLEQMPGSTGHAPGLLGRNSPSPAMAAMATYSARLFSDLPADGPTTTPVGSLELTRDRDRVGAFRRKIETAKDNGLDARLVSPDEAGTLVPYLDMRGLAGGLFVEGDVTVEVRSALRAIQQEALLHGVAFQWDTEAFGFLSNSDGVTGIRTAAGVIGCRTLVIAAGIWGREVGVQLRLDLPILPVQHPYVTTEPLPFLSGASAPAARPFVRDLDRLFYLREHGDRLGYGWYNHGPLACETKTLRRADIAYLSAAFDHALDYELFPCLREAPIARRLNGIFSMTPDGAPLLGPARGFSNVWLAEAIWVTHAGGAAKALAELMTGREPSIDLAPFRPDRFSGRPAEAVRRAAFDLYSDIYAWPPQVPTAA